MELKAGTSDEQIAPGTVVFDNLKVYQSTAPTETVLFSDDFDGASLDTTKWDTDVQSGTRDANVPLAQRAGTINIGPLFTNTADSHYNGILSTLLDLTSAAASAEIVTPPDAATTADAMLTLTYNSSNHYRIWLEQGVLHFEVRTEYGGKQAVGPALAFDATTYAYWRIRHDPVWDDIVFETAPKISGAPGAWVEQARTPRTINITAIKVELKAGTYQSESTPPGTVQFDTVKVVR